MTFWSSNRIYHHARTECHHAANSPSSAFVSTKQRRRTLKLARSLFPQHQTFSFTAISVVKGHFRTHAPQQNPPHSSTSSASDKNDLGIVRPSALAVLRLTTTSNFVGNCTGRSVGLAPLSNLLTYSAPCWN